ncbi:hypothetical protein PIB30_092782 [Stylosanthes scabra]|uniref:Uncharacterized protein n=1 Tax=Stylosanthes scabra TaxID=79078 RepID=A0ABU6TXA5_9FABA|nr:hypothetical protein [Stylosanthes scabra]
MNMHSDSVILNERIPLSPQDATSTVEDEGQHPFTRRRVLAPLQLGIQSSNIPPYIPMGPANTFTGDTRSLAHEFNIHFTIPNNKNMHKLGNITIGTDVQTPLESFRPARMAFQVTLT